MRKSIKIKTSVLLISWLIILAHGIVPHNHPGYEGSLSLHHSFGHETGLCSHTETSYDCSGDEACKISGLLFHNISQDENFLPSRSGIFSPTNEEIVENIPDFDTGLLKTGYGNLLSSRAPPHS